MTIEVRPVRPAEHDAVGRLTVAAYDAVGRVSDEYRQALTAVADRLDTDSNVLVAVERDAGHGRDTVVGSVTVVGAGSSHFEHGGHGDGGFRMLAVAPGAQGRGVAGRLLDAVLEHAQEHGWRRVTITTMSWMHPAHRLYETAGFVRRPDLDVRFSSGIGVCYALDLTADAAAHFPPPGPVPDEPPPFVPHADRPPGC